MKNTFFNFYRLAFTIHGIRNFRVYITIVAQMQRRIFCFFCTYVQKQLFPCFDKETQTTAFIYCYIDTVVGLSIVKFISLQ